MCTVPNFKYHILLIAEKDKTDLMQKLDFFCFTYHLVDCHTLYIIQVSLDGKIVTKNGQVFVNIEPAVRFNQRHKTVERMPSMAKMRLLRKTLEETFTEFDAIDNFNTDEWISICRQDWTS